jgi:hypothetical protein
VTVGVQKAWSLTASDNGSADDNINFAEQQTPASLNNSARALMASVKGWANQISAAKTTGGSSNAYTFTSDSVAAIATSYAAGMAFAFKANHTNTGAATLNVDSVGAKNIRKGGAQAALVANDIVSGGIYLVMYEASGDCFALLNPETGATAQDATLTALAALSWSSGSPLVQFTAADTVSLTLTPSVSSITASQGGGATTPSANFTNSTDNASVQVLRLQGDRATPASADEAYVSFYLSDSAGNQDEFARIVARATTVTSLSEAGRLDFYVANSGAIGSSQISLGAGVLRPSFNDGVTLGNTSFGWADYFGASGHTWNCNNGNVILAHNNTQAVIEATTGKLVSGLKASTETSGTLTVASRNRVVNCSGGVTLDDGVFATDDWIIFDPGTSARTFTRASGLTMYVNGVDSASATLAANQMGSAYWRSATVVVLAGAFT